LSIGDNRHITIAYNNYGDTPEKIAELTLHLQSLETNRLIRPVELLELSNHLDQSDPLWAVRLEIMDSQGIFVDRLLMERITEFSNKWSWRESLADLGLEQYNFTLHTTIGPKSKYTREQALAEMNNLQLKTGSKYYKIHKTGQKVFFN
jgi:hypothetical protein